MGPPTITRHDSLEGQRDPAPCPKTPNPAGLRLCGRLLAFELCPQQRELLLIACRVAVVDKLAVVRMRRAHALRVPDRTPVLFRPSGDLADVCQNSVRISAVAAVHLLDQVR